LTCRFDAAAHVYTDEAGRELPHITGILLKAGLVDDTFYTAESSARGRYVHALTTDYDLGVLDPVTCTSAYKGYLQAYARAMAIVRPEWDHIEVPMAHDVLRFAGRPDRIGRMYGLISVLEIKSGVPHPAHQIQTALQALLAAQETGLPAIHHARYAVYIRSDGKFKLEQHHNADDIRNAEWLVGRFA